MIVDDGDYNNTSSGTKANQWKYMHAWTDVQNRIKHRFSFLHKRPCKTWTLDVLEAMVRLTSGQCH